MFRQTVQRGTQMQKTLGTLSKLVREESVTGRKMFLVLAEILGNKNHCTVANNTMLTRYSDGPITVVLHWTNILQFHPDNTVTLRMGGWNSVTTRARMNLFSPASPIAFRVYTKDYAPYVVTMRRREGVLGHVRTALYEEIASAPFVEGMTINLETGAIN